MRYKGRRQSSNIEDRRSLSTGRKVGISGGVLSIVIVIVFVLMGGDPQTILSLMQSGSDYSATSTEYQPTAQEEELAEFVAVVLADTEDVWHKLFK